MRTKLLEKVGSEESTEEDLKSETDTGPQHLNTRWWCDSYEESFDSLDEQVSKHKLNARPVANVHDEFQYEVVESQAEDFGNLAVDSIINAGKELELDVL